MKNSRRETLLRACWLRLEAFTRLLVEIGAADRVELIRFSPALLEEERRLCTSYERFGPFVETEVQARQVHDLSSTYLRFRAGLAM